MRALVLGSKILSSKDNVKISSKLVMDLWLILFVLMGILIVGTFVTKQVPKYGQARDCLLFAAE